MTTPLDDYLASRFGPVFDALNDAGGVPEGLAECLKRGVVWSLMDRMGEVPMGDKAFAGELRFGLFTESRLTKNGRVTEATLQNRPLDDFRPRPTFTNFTPDDLFPHLSHLIEQEV